MSFLKRFAAFLLGPAMPGFTHDETAYNCRYWTGDRKGYNLNAVCWECQPKPQQVVTNERLAIARQRDEELWARTQEKRWERRQSE